jgi:hypothetical protein
MAIKSLILEKLGKEEVSASRINVNQILELLADLATRSPDDITRRCFLIVLYRFLPRLQVADYLKGARSRVLELENQPMDSS